MSGIPDDEDLSRRTSTVLPGISLQRNASVTKNGRQLLTGITKTAIPNSERKTAALLNKKKIQDDPQTMAGYASVPLLDVQPLPRGGISIDTKIGRIQFGIPPETIKDSMRLGLEVPRVYIVPAEQFCREMGPALGVNLAEFEYVQHTINMAAHLASFRSP